MAGVRVGSSVGMQGRETTMEGTLVVVAEAAEGEAMAVNGKVVGSRISARSFAS